MKVLQVVPYPLDRPRHGGQVRCRAIRDYLLELGHEVTVLSALCWEKGASDLGPVLNLSDDIIDGALGPTLRMYIPNFVQDSYYCDRPGQNEIRNLISDQDFDVVWVDQPFMFRPIMQAIADARVRPLFVYSSQNIESNMYASILSQIPDVTDSQVDFWLAAITAQEMWATKNADLVVAVTDADREILQQWTSAPVITAPNASRAPCASRELESKIIETLGVHDFALFIASAHPPNLQGFLEMLGGDLSYIPPRSPIIIAGSVAESLKFYCETHPTSTILSRTILLQNCGDNELDALRNLAKVFILPITSGGGSNLKTAEALLSPGKIVATTAAFRGYEKYINSSGIVIADDSSIFRRELVAALKADCTKGYPVASTQSQPLVWSHALHEIAHHLNVLSASDSRFQQKVDADGQYLG